MKNQNFYLIELTRSEVLNLKPTQQILVYNPFSNIFHFEFADKNCSARNQFASPSLRYFLFNLSEKLDK